MFFLIKKCLFDHVVIILIDEDFLLLIRRKMQMECRILFHRKKAEKGRKRISAVCERERDLMNRSEEMCV